MRTSPLTIVSALALAACGGTNANKASPAAANTAGNHSTSAGPNVLGTIDGSPITVDDLDRDVLVKIRDLDNEAMQRRVHFLWVGLEDKVAERVLAKEAHRRGITVENLREQDIFGKLIAPTDEEVQQFYDQNAGRIGVDYKTAEPHIRTELTNERTQALERALVDRLREQVQVKYSLPVPELPRVAINVGSGPSWGKSEAKVTLVEFSDFECPYCARASIIIQKLKELYPNDLRVEFRDYPLAQHGTARAAAEAARCADEQGKFWEYHDLLFANSKAQGPDDLKKYAGESGLDTAVFARCLASERPKTAVESSIALGQKASVEGTPAIYINGIRLIGLLPLPLMQAFIDRELGRP